MDNATLKSRTEMRKQYIAEKITLVLMIKQYEDMLKDIEQILWENRNIEEEKCMQDLYALGNNLTQQLDDMKRELKYA